MLGKQSPHGTWRGPYVALRWEQAAIAGAAAVFLALALPQVGRPLIYDEVDFAKAARAVAGGSFRYDRGYIADYAHAPDRGERYQLALFHPPGYLLALAAWQRPAGSADAALRTFGVACGLASLAAAVVLGRIAGGGEAADAVRTAAGAPRESAPAAFPALFALVSLLRTAQWLHPLLVGLLVAAPLAFRRLEPAAALLVAAGATLTLDLVKLAAGFPKYHAGVFPLVAAAAGAAGAAWLRACPSWPAYALAGAALGGAATLATGGDALIHHADLNLLAAWLAAAAACLALATLLGAGRPA